MKKQRSFKDQQTGILYLVPTPIGNLEDMTFRSVRTLKEVAWIASEDTRNTQKLLNHFEIETPQKSLHEHNYRERIPQLLELLKKGDSIAQVSDAGMPSISDPGHELVVACIEEEIPVVSLPGPTAGLTALIASGLSPQPNVFYGFLPRKKKEQVQALEALKAEKSTLIFYESPYRIGGTVKQIADVFGSERQAVICRELTKIHEEYLRGSLAELADYLEENEIKGECCLLVSGNEGEETAAAVVTDKSLKEQVEELVQEGMKPNAAIKEVAQRNQVKKQVVYKEFHGIE
ncbi:16S rRNA (cytidine(1402)-2'-O)-methyltransferase [Enterococcus mediterraneensis]|uniref:16S rRNA (cytidine(1402)-2'-O)-methyltransferase n=1 Tax=Enterococcus mediterraneensis TaxID=2364791 RepID=UPI000F049148|nr:16S rRNA (cytidine(1402)-2'-O)-methyltransferase [Enterococcus mediterraneensis]